MTDAGHFTVAVLSTVLLVYAPGYCWARLTRLPRLYAMGAAPALTAGGFAISAIIAEIVGMVWGAPTAVISTALIAVIAAVSGRWCVHAPIPAVPRPATRRGRELIGWAVAVGASALIAVGPVLWSMPGVGAVLQRWDALYHLNAIEHVRSTGDGSTLTLGTIAFSDSRASLYPAAFHDVAALVPAPTLIAHNAAAITMAVVPWSVGLALLARALWPRVPWAGPAAAAMALLAPASPLSEWVHLSATPNLVAFAVLPGAGALAISAWRASAAGQVRPQGLIISLGLIALCMAGVALLHPNVFVAACIMALAFTALDAFRIVRIQRSRWPLALVPAAAGAAVLAVVLLPASTVAQDFDGGLAVPLPQAVGEVATGLLTVWPMSAGVGLWVLAWIGAWSLLRRRSWGPLLCAAIASALYLDAAVDSRLGLSVLWYRGQDRISMLMTLIAVTIAIPGLAQIGRWWMSGRSRSIERARHGVAIGAVFVTVLALSSIPQRVQNTAANFDLERSDRNRYFDTEEWELLQAIGPTLDHDKVLVASPFSGGAHLFAQSGQPVRFPTAGHALRPPDPEVIEAAADPSARNCDVLERAGVGYVYVDARSYNSSPDYTPLQKTRIDGLTPLASTHHSALYEIECG